MNKYGLIFFNALSLGKLISKIAMKSYWEVFQHIFVYPWIKKLKEIFVTLFSKMFLVKVAHDCAKVAAAICVNGKKWE